MTWEAVARSWQAGCRDADASVDSAAGMLTTSQVLRAPTSDVGIADELPAGEAGLWGSGPVPRSASERLQISASPKQHMLASHMPRLDQFTYIPHSVYGCSAFG